MPIFELFDLKVKAPYAKTIRQADASLGDAFEANARVLDGDCEEVQLILKPSKDTRHSAVHRLRSVAKKLLKIGDFRENTARFQIRGTNADTDKVELVDLLRDQLIARKQLLRLGQRNRAVDPELAVGAIHEAYNELRDELRQAAGVS